MMQLGFVSAILPEYDLEEVFAVASQCGYECVEVMCWPPGKAERRYAGTTHIDVNDLTDKRIEEIQSLCQRYDVAISSLGYYPNPLSPDESESKVAAEHLIRLIGASSQLGIGRVTTFVGRDPKKTIDDNWPRVENVWGPSSKRPRSPTFESASKIAPCFSPTTNGPAERIWRSVRRYGDECLRHSRANTSD